MISAVSGPRLTPALGPIPTVVRSPFATPTGVSDTFTPGTSPLPPVPSAAAQAAPRGSSLGAGAALALGASLVLVGVIGVVIATDPAGPIASITQTISPEAQAYDDLSWLQGVGHDAGGGLSRPVLGTLGPHISPTEAVERLRNGDRVLYRERSGARPYAIDSFADAHNVRLEVRDHRISQAADQALGSVQRGVGEASRAVQQGVQDMRDALRGRR